MWRKINASRLFKISFVRVYQLLSGTRCAHNENDCQLLSVIDLRDLPQKH